MEKKTQFCIEFYVSPVFFYVDDEIQSLICLYINLKIDFPLSRGKVRNKMEIDVGRVTFEFTFVVRISL